MRKFEENVVFILLMLASGAGQAFLASPRQSGVAEGQPFTQVIFGLIYLLLAALLFRTRTAAIRLVLQERWIAMLSFWALASSAWSVDPSETLRRALALAGTMIAGLYIGMRFEPREQLKFISWTLGIGAVASLAVGLAMPSVGILDAGWQGVYNTKNGLGRVMSMGALCFALQALGERRHRIVRIGMFGLCIVLVALAGSATAVVVTLLVLGMLPLRKLLYLRKRYLLGAVAMLAPVLAAFTFWAVENSDELFGALGRTSSLTGRIPLWRLVMQMIASRPMRGFGFGAFWSSWEGSRISDTVKWDTAVPHAHNGFLETWLGLGVVGLIFLVLSLRRNFVLALRVARMNQESEYSWPLLLVAFTVLYNLTEVSVLAVNSLMWMTYGAASYWLVQEAQESRFEVEADTDPNRKPVEPVYSA